LFFFLLKTHMPFFAPFPVYISCGKTSRLTVPNVCLQCWRLLHNPHKPVVLPRADPPGREKEHHDALESVWQ
jgi:hypothetical protein